MSDPGVREVTLPELLSFIVDNRGRTCPVVDDGFPLIATNSVSDTSRRVVPKDVRYVDQETYDNWFRAHPQPNDVLFVCKGTPGKVALVPDPVPYCIAQDMVALRADSAKVDPLYLYYRLTAADVRERIEGLHVGTLIPHFKKGDFAKLRFSIHGLDEQRRIAAVLGALDDLIETNEAFVRSLVNLAIARLSRGGVSTVRVAAVATLSRGLSYKGLGLTGPDDPEAVAMVNLANFAQSGWLNMKGLKHYAEQFKPAHVLHEGDLVIANTDLTQRREILGRGALVPPDLEGAIHSHHTSLVAFTDAPWLRLFLWANLQGSAFRERALGFATGTTVTALPKEAVLEFDIPLPSDAEKVAVNAESLIRQAWALEQEIRQLTRAREELLPLLMSGRVRVSEELAVA